MLYQIFFSPHVKRSGIISTKHGIYEVPHELPNDLRLRILGNQETLGKCLNPIEDIPAPSLPTIMKTLPILAKTS